MSRVGNAPISIPGGVEIKVSKSNLVEVKGPNGALSQQFDPDIELKIEEQEVHVNRPSEQKRHKSLHGLTRAILSNMVTGVSEGFKKELELVGVGYRVSNTGNLLEILVGYSHPIYFYVPEEIKVETLMEKGKNPAIKLSCADNQLLGQVAAKIRSLRKPEPYKGKGIKFIDETLRRKAGKTAG